MLKFIDNFLNSITMYRLVLYYLIFLVAIALIYSTFGILPFGVVPLSFSTTILIAVSFVTNKIFEKIFEVQVNVESFYITALILVLIITPAKDINGIIFTIIAAVLAVASKYILNIKGKHIFNPAAIAVVITAFTIHRYASWWVGTGVMLPFTLLGILIVRKIRRFDLVFYFFITAFTITLVLSFLRGNTDILQIIKTTIFDSPILFFAFVMLTEPLTTPPTVALQSLYGGLVGILFAPIHVGIFFTTPEIALSIGNIISYIISPKQKLILNLKEKLKLTDNIYDFVFTSKEKLNFRPGEYLEWTLGQKNTDARGNRRYFTIASSPTESGIRIGVKYAENSSSFKQEMLNMKLGSAIVASQLAGDFTLPKDKKQKLVLIAGGIGITPFRSMIKYMIDTNQIRNLILIYSDKTKDAMVYKDIFEKAREEFGTVTIYYESEKNGHITSQFIASKIPDFKDRIFYLSGSHGMVTGFKAVLSELKVTKKQIKMDYFPGF